MKFIKNLIMMLIVLFNAIYVVSADNFDYSKLTETLLNQDPDPVEPGEYVELRFKVEKEGNEALKDIEYELVPEYPFSFDSSDMPIKKLGDWVGTSDEKEFYTLYYKLKVDENALEGVYDLTLLQRSKNSQTEKEFEFDIRVDEKKKPNLIVGKVETLPNKLIADYDSATIKVEIVNMGDEAAEQVIVDINLPNGFEESFGYSTLANIGTIPQGQSAIATLHVDTNQGIRKGNHKASLNIKYTEDDEGLSQEIIEKDLDFDISVFGRPEYEIIFQNVSDVLPGKKAQVNLIIKNIGSRESDSTSIQVFKDSSQPFSFDDKSDFIGKIDINQEGQAKFEFEVEEDAIAKDYKLKLQIRSVVDEDVLTEDETINVKVLGKPKNSTSQNPKLRFIFYATFLVVGFILGRLISKKKLLKKIKK